MYQLKTESHDRRGATQAVALTLTLLAVAACGPAPDPAPEAAPVEPTTVVLYEGARLIVGDGSVIENAAFSVDAGRILAVGAAGDVSAPAGASRVDLSGMTVMPAIVNAHVHMNTTRD